MPVSIAGETSVEIGSPVPLFETHMLNGTNVAVGFRAQYEVTRDGQRFLMNMPIDEDAPSPITVVLNWMTTLKK